MEADEKPQQEPDKQPPPDRGWVATDIIHKEEQPPAESSADGDE